MGKETTCADLSLESLTNFIFAKKNLVFLYYASQRFNQRGPHGLHIFQEFQPLCFHEFSKFNEFMIKMSLWRVLEISMRALQQTLNLAHGIKRRQGFEGQVTMMSHTMDIQCKWDVFSMHLQCHSCFWALESANTICTEAQQGFCQCKPLHVGITPQGSHDHKGQVV